MSATLEWLHTNLDGIIVSIVAAVILSLIHYIKNKPKEINELLKCKNFNDINWIDDLDKSLEIKNTMKRHFPEYTDYLLIQYGYLIFFEVYNVAYSMNKVYLPWLV